MPKETVKAFTSLKFLEKHHDIKYEAIARYAVQQKQRVGGHFAISYAVFTKRQREVCRKVIGKDLIIIVLKLDKKSQYQDRIQKRHGENMSKKLLDFLVYCEKYLEDVSDTEENAYQINITEDMTQNDVMERVLKIID